MRWLGIAAVGLAVTAVAEIVAFLLVARAIGVGWTFLIVVTISIIGGWLLRREGVRGWRRLRAALAQGRAPGDEGTDGLLGLFAGLLLVLPGLLTDVAGLVLLFPPVRRLARQRIRAAAERRVSTAVAGGVFGPRLVRARRGRAVPDPASGVVADPPASAPGPPANAIEGEIVEPDDPR